MVVAVLSDIPDPGEGLVAGLLDDLEVAHLDARGGKVGDLKLDADWRFALVEVSDDAGQAKVGLHQVFFAARERLDRPDDRVSFRRILAVANSSLELGRVGIARHRDDHLDVVCRGPALELGLGLDHDLDPAMAVLLNHRLDPDEGLDVGVEPVGHQLKLAVRRDERDGPIVFEPRQPHALVELDVLQLDRLALTAAGRLEEYLVVEAEAQLRHTRQVDAHLDGANNLGAQDIARGAGQHVDALDHV